MPNRARTAFTTEELVATLKRSSLPTVVVEGDDDILVFRKLEQIYEHDGLSVMPVGGRDAVLALFDRSAEFGRNTNAVFIADLDRWACHGVPAEYQKERLILTNGYSLENDVIRDLRLEALLTPTERSQYRLELIKFLKWYSLAFTRGGGYAIHPNQILDNATRMAQEMALRPGEEYPNFVYFELSRDYLALVRGKSLLALLLRHLSYAGRPSRHNAAALMEMAAVTPGPLLALIFGKVASAIHTK